MTTIASRLALTAMLLSLAAIANAGAQQTFLPTGVQAPDSISGVYPGDTEGDCCWLSDGGAIRLSPPSDANALLINVFIPPFALSNGPQRLYVKIGTDPEQITEPLAAGEHDLVFNLQQPTLPPELEVQIRPAYTFVPAQLGMNPDLRHLSVLVRAVHFATQADVVVLPPDAPPQIVFLRLNKTTFASGDTVTGAITTSSNVASVEARIANFSVPVPRVGEGRFALSYRVPKLPRYLKRTYELVVIARNTDGVKTQRVVPITVH